MCGLMYGFDEAMFDVRNPHSKITNILNFIHLIIRICCKLIQFSLSKWKCVAMYILYMTSPILMYNILYPSAAWSAPDLSRIENTQFHNKDNI